MKQRVSLVSVGVALALVSLGAHVVVPTEFREVVGDAGLIVRGVITDVRSVAVGGRGIDSIATVAVESVMKGEAVAFIAVRVPGGEIGRVRYVMPGAPKLRRGERAVFFLREQTDGTWRPVGLSLGVERVFAEPRTRRAVVSAPVLAGTTAAPGPVVRGDLRRQPMAILEYESLVRLVVAGRVISPPTPRADRGSSR